MNGPLPALFGIRLVARLISIVLVVFMTPRVEAETLDDGIEFFEKRIRPALVEHCFECHSHRAKRLKGGLRLDSLPGLMEGGDTGPAIDQKTPEKSLLLSALHQRQFEMPPSGKLGKELIQSFERWIALGFPAPSDFQSRPGAVASPISSESHWAFEPITRPSLPSVRLAHWVKNPIDFFVLKTLEDKGLQPSAAASPEQLIRRTSFDLTGLPPLALGLSAPAERLPANWYPIHIDRLLANPHFGEHWGRKWLDLARYADTNGVDENFNYLHAWRYRDYVVHSLNRDHPFDRFLTEQIAGDLLPKPAELSRQAEQISATGFLTLGPKMLAEQDKDKLLIDIVDEQLDVLGKTTMGLTLGCARCHDHKFDPISSEDYYALAGIFASTKTMSNTNHVSFWVETVLPHVDNPQKEAEHEQAIKRHAEQIEALSTDEESDDAKKKRKKLETELQALKKNGPNLPKAMAVVDGTARDLPIHVRGSHLNLGPTAIARGFPKHISQRMESSRQPDAGSGRRELAAWLVAPDHPLTARVIVNRIWQGYFGTGLVSTPSNFGLRGANPSHPALLDWLASELQNHAWSLKHIHRLILNSATYQQTSAMRPNADQVDPSNRFYWRQNRKRLSAESIRDFILLLGNELDQRIGGRVAKADRNETYYRGNGDEFTSNRRAIYLPVIRGRGYDMFNTFDYADSGTHLAQRTTTVVPHQALFMLNAPLVKASSEQMATLFQQIPDLSSHDLITSIYQRLFFRESNPSETNLALEHLTRLRSLSTNDSDRTPLGILIQSLIAANEFIYVD